MNIKTALPVKEWTTMAKPKHRVWRGLHQAKDLWQERSVHANSFFENTIHIIGEKTEVNHQPIILILRQNYQHQELFRQIYMQAILSR